MYAEFSNQQKLHGKIKNLYRLLIVIVVSLVDMAVFRDLLRLKLPRLSQHLHHLQKAANREAGGTDLCVLFYKNDTWYKYSYKILMPLLSV